MSIRSLYLLAVVFPLSSAWAPYSRVPRPLSQLCANVDSPEWMFRMAEGFRGVRFGGAVVPAGRGKPTVEGPGAAAVRQYFDAWNRRDMAAACDLFSADCVYEDTLYPDSFKGKAALEAHLYRVADALPPSFAFVVDEVADGGCVGSGSISAAAALLIRFPAAG